ncbi:hexokinase A [Entomortierella beljakovae]|nr:hexokinase A [Entomortierella beljakovae]
MSRTAQANQEVIENLNKIFDFPTSAYGALVDQFINELNEGLSQEKKMPMIPTFVYDLPTGQETGELLSLDLGGTNLRVCLTTLSGNGVFETNHKKWTVPDSIKKGPGKELFAWIAEKIEDFHASSCCGRDPNQNYPLGMTFSFPCEQYDINVGKLINWTKGFRGNDVLGQDVVKILQDCIDARHLHITVNSLINDTVGTLLATAYKHPGCQIGIIFGTGTNCAYLEAQSEIAKIKPEAANYTSPTNMQVINTEWGAFGNKSNALPANEYDRLLDSKSSQPGNQLYEKMVSGLYVSELTRIVIHDLASRGLLFTEDVTKPKNSEELGNLAIKERFDGAMMGSIDGDESDNLDVIKSHFLDSYNLTTTLSDRETIKCICQLISVRAARLSAVGIGALIKKRKLLSSLEKVIVGIDGSLFNKYPKFREHLEEAMHEILGEDPAKSRVSLIHAEDGSGVGGAIAAYLACQQKIVKCILLAETIEVNHWSQLNDQKISSFLMTDSTPQPEYYLHLDLTEGELDSQQHAVGGDSFLDFSEPVHGETEHMDITGQSNQWQQSGVKAVLGEAVSVEGQPLSENIGGFSSMIEDQVTIGTNAAHWNGSHQVYGSLMDMEFNKLSPSEQVSDCITPGLIFPSGSLQENISTLDSEGQGSSKTTELLPQSTTEVSIPVKQIVPASKKAVALAATAQVVDIRRSTRTRRQSSLAAQSEEYLQNTQGAPTGIISGSAPVLMPAPPPPPPERFTRSKKLYCYCQKPDDGEVMIQCDNCRQWFHGACVDVTAEVAELMGLKNEKFFCDPCTEKLKVRAKSHPGKSLRSTRLSDAQDCALPTCLNEARATNSYCSEECAIKGIELEASQAVKKEHRPSAIVIPLTKTLISHSARKLSSPVQPLSPVQLKSPTSPKPEQNSVRSTALKGLTESLMVAFDSSSDHKDMDAERASQLATVVEKELYMFTATPGQSGCGKDYKAKYRSLFFNLKDKNNESLRARVLSGELEPRELVRLTPEELANPELQSIAEEVRKRSIHDSVLTIEQEPFIKKTHKGDVSYIPGSSSMNEVSTVTNFAQNKVKEQETEKADTTKETSDENVMEEIVQEQSSNKSTPAGSPTTDALDKLLARIQTNKRSGEDILSDALSSGKRQKQFETDYDRSSYLPREPSPYSPSPSPSGSPVLTSTTPPNTPPPFMLEEIERKLKNKPNASVNQQSLSIWQGFVEMDQVAKVFVRAIQIGGSKVIPGRVTTNPAADMVAAGWADIFTKKVVIEGRIPVTAVESYIAQQRQSISKEIHIIQFELNSAPTASFEQRRAEFEKLFHYFHDKARNGVIPHKARQVKDMYLVPVGANDPLPKYFHGLVENDALVQSNGIRRDALFGVLVVNKASSHQQRHGLSHGHSPSHTKSSSSQHRHSGSANTRPYAGQHDRRESKDHQSGGYSPAAQPSRPQVPSNTPTPFSVGVPVTAHQQANIRPVSSVPTPAPVLTPSLAKPPSLEQLQGLVDQLFHSGKSTTPANSNPGIAQGLTPAAAAIATQLNNATASNLIAGLPASLTMNLSQAMAQLSQHQHQQQQQNHQHAQQRQSHEPQSHGQQPFFRPPPPPPPPPPGMPVPPPGFPLHLIPQNAPRPPLPPVPPPVPPHQIQAFLAHFTQRGAQAAHGQHPPQPPPPVPPLPPFHPSFHARPPPQHPQHKQSFPPQSQGQDPRRRREWS